MDWFKIGKWYLKAEYCHSEYFHFLIYDYLTYAEYIIWNAGLDEAQAEIKIAKRNINNLRYADDTTLMAESEELKISWWKWRGEWKSWLKAQYSEN